mgnify:CR=1 FL=1
MGELILVLGGARSGKSWYAEKLAVELGGDKVLFVATAEARDEEMRLRIQTHRANRPVDWRTLEAPMGLAAALGATLNDAPVVLLDCVTLWVTNILLSLGEEPAAEDAEKAVMAEVQALVDLISHSEATFIAVSNEVGMGVVPAYPLGRLYRDLLGRVNQVLAAHADQVVLMIAGLAIDIKALQAEVAARTGAGQ